MFKTLTLSLRKFVTLAIGVLMLTPNPANHDKALKKMGIILLPDNSVAAAAQPTKPSFHGTCHLYQTKWKS